MTAAVILLGWSVALWGGTTPLLAKRANDGGVVDGGALRVSISLGENPQSKFLVSLCNESGKPLALKLGERVGSRTLIDSLTLEVRSKRGKRSKWFPIDGGIASGRPMPFVVLLPPDASLMLSLALSNYTTQVGAATVLSPGQYSVRAIFHGSAVKAASLQEDEMYLTYWPYWVGTISSASVDFVVARQPAHSGKKHRSIHRNNPDTSLHLGR